MRLAGLVYRAHNPRWSFAPSSGDGAARYGGRFNPAGVPALYTSRRMETAWLEAQQGLTFKTQPLTICAYEVDCTDVADLSGADLSGADLSKDDVCRDLGVALSDLACPWEDLVSRGVEPPSWRLAKRLIGEGYAAIVVPSFARGATKFDRNIVFWKWTEVLPHQVLVVDDEARLP